MTIASKLWRVEHFKFEERSSTRAQQQVQVGVPLLSFARHMRRVGGDALQQVDIIGAPIMTMTWREFESSCFDRASTLNR